MGLPEDAAEALRAGLAEAAGLPEALLEAQPLPLSEPDGEPPPGEGEAEALAQLEALGDAVPVTDAVSVCVPLFADETLAVEDGAALPVTVSVGAAEPVPSGPPLPLTEAVMEAMKDALTVALPEPVAAPLAHTAAVGEPRGALAEGEHVALAHCDRDRLPLPQPLALLADWAWLKVAVPQPEAVSDARAPLGEAPPARVGEALAEGVAPAEAEAALAVAGALGEAATLPEASPGVALPRAATLPLPPPAPRRLAVLLTLDMALALKVADAVGQLVADRVAAAAEGLPQPEGVYEKVAVGVVEAVPHSEGLRLPEREAAALPVAPGEPDALAEPHAVRTEAVPLADAECVAESRGLCDAGTLAEALSDAAEPVAATARLPLPAAHTLAVSEG